MAHLFDEFRRVGADLVLLDCPGDAADARRLYDKLGFEVRGYNLTLKLSKGTTHKVRSR